MQKKLDTTFSERKKRIRPYTKALAKPAAVLLRTHEYNIGLLMHHIPLLTKSLKRSRDVATVSSSFYNHLYNWYKSISEFCKYSRVYVKLKLSMIILHKYITTLLLLKALKVLLQWIVYSILQPAAAKDIRACIKQIGLLRARHTVFSWAQWYCCYMVWIGSTMQY